MRIAFIGTEKGLVEHTRCVRRSDIIYLVIKSVEDTKGHVFKGYILHESSDDLTDVDRIIANVKIRIK